MEVATLIQALVSLAPAFGKMIETWVKTPAEKRSDYVKKLTKAFEKDRESGGTKNIEDMLSKL